MPNLPENGTPTPGTVQAVVTRPAVEAVLNNKPAESTLENTFLGTEAAQSLAAKGEGNVFIGPGAGKAVLKGSSNVGIGVEAMKSTKEGNANIALGISALALNKEGAANIAIGPNALESNTTGGTNVVIGVEAGKGVTGSGNVMVGSYAGKTETSVSNKLIVANNESTAIIKGVMSATEASQEIGFLGAAPVKRASHPTTLAEVITILKNLGFCE